MTPTTAKPAKPVVTMQSIEQQYKQLDLYTDQLVELAGYVEVFKHSDVEVTTNSLAPSDLTHKKINRAMLTNMKTQLKKLRDKTQKQHLALFRKMTISNIDKPKPTREQRVLPLEYPVLLSDDAITFFKTVNLGNTNADMYAKKNRSDAMYIDGRDIGALQTVNASVYPGQNFSDEQLAEFSVHKHLDTIFENNIANSFTVNHLFSLYSHVYKIVSSKASVYHTTDVFEKLILDTPVRFVVKGVDLLEGVAYKQHIPDMARLIAEGEAADAATSIAEKNCTSWLRSDAITPANKASDAYLLWNNNDYADLQATFTEAKNRSKATTKRANDLLLSIFPKKSDTTDPYPLMTKLINNGKTFREVLNSRPGQTDKKRCLIPKDQADPKTPDVWGYLKGMHAVIKSYFVIPTTFVQHSVDDSKREYLRDQAVIHNVIDTASFLKDLSASYDKSE